MSDEWSAYNEDPREACKYGSDCYRKNLQHLSTYKHPPKVTEKRAEKRPCSRSSESEESNQKRKKEEVDPLPGVQDKTTEESTNNTINAGQVDNKTTEKSTNNTHNPGQVDNKTTEDTTNNTINKIDLPKDLTYYKSDDHAVLQELFLVEMPDDFFKFFEFLNSDGALEKTLASVNLELIGPYDLLLGRLPKLDNKELYLIHWRFFYDPPEFQLLGRYNHKATCTFLDSDPYTLSDLVRRRATLASYEEFVDAVLSQLREFNNATTAPKPSQGPTSSPATTTP